MPASLPPLSLQLSDTGTPVVRVEGEPIDSIAELLRRVPVLAEPNWVKALARFVNHLSHGYDYEMIMDPAAFEVAYRAAYEAEPEVATDAPIVPVRLRDLGLPDFTCIRPPTMVGDTLVFFVRSGFYGIPYQVAYERDGNTVYTPVPMVT
jgi:hypothetical protein